VNAAQGLARQVGVSPACRALGVARATFYRTTRKTTGQQQPRKSPARALSPTERVRVREVLYEPRFADRSPGEVAATLLDEGRYLCSERTMYRLLAEGGESRERRNQRRHPVYTKPKLVATAPNEVWSWDIERHEALSNRVVMKGHGRPSVAADWLKLRAA
jgi:putative transposase